MSDITLEPLITEFLEYLEIEKGCSFLTTRVYRHYLNRFHNWLSENSPTTKAKDINLEDVRGYRLYLAHFRNRNGVPLKRVSQSYHIIALRAFYVIS